MRLPTRDSIELELINELLTDLNKLDLDVRVTHTGRATHLYVKNLHVGDFFSPLELREELQEMLDRTGGK